jgi:hypothetical protein
VTADSVVRTALVVSIGDNFVVKKVFVFFVAVVVLGGLLAVVLQ